MAINRLHRVASFSESERFPRVFANKTWALKWREAGKTRLFEYSREKMNATNCQENNFPQNNVFYLPEKQSINIIKSQMSSAPEG